MDFVMLLPELPTSFPLVPQALFDLDPILLGRVGSVAYGTNTPESDEDYMGVCIANANVYLGLDNWHNDGTKEFKREVDKFDSVSYELKKFLKLCLAFNPNVIPLLYLRMEDYILLEPAGAILLENRKLFNSKRAYHTFCGYAHGQINRMKVGVTGKLGAKRKELVERYGYDTKFAYHTIRLLRMLCEFLESNGETLGVYREKDSSELKCIRTGEWTIEYFYGEAEKYMETAKELLSKTTLPDEPDYAGVNEMCKHVIADYLRGIR